MDFDKQMEKWIEEFGEFLDSNMHYILNENLEPVPVDLLTWARWLEENYSKRIVAVSENEDGVSVSTVFLGLDHRFLSDGPPIVFESMVFGGEHDGEMERYCTYKEAANGHREICERIGVIDLLDAEIITI